MATFMIFRSVDLHRYRSDLWVVWTGIVRQGFTHDLLLKVGVFLAKLILMARKNAETEERLERHRIQIKELLEGQ
jgi:hypothetical protein